MPIQPPTDRLYPPPPSANALHRFFARIYRASLDLPIIELSTLERKRLSAELYPLYQSVAHAISQGLIMRPKLFPDLAEPQAQGQKLHDRLERASVWFALRDQFRDLATVCNDWALFEQASAAKEAGQIADQVLFGLRHPDLQPNLNHPLRMAALMSGLYYRYRGKRQKGNGPKRRMAAARPESQEQKQSRRAALQALFRQVVSAHR